MKKWIAFALLCAMTFLCAAPAWAQSIKEDGEYTDRASQLLSEMTLEQKVYQLFVVTPEMLTGAKVATLGGDMTREALKQYPVGGIVYFSQNLVDRDQTALMIENTLKFAGEMGMPGLFIAVDEEGGTVARVAGKLGTTKFPNMGAIGKTGDTDQAYQVGATIAGDIAQFGFNLDYAPVADVLIESTNTEIGNRSFGTDPELVGDMVSAVVRGLQDNGVIATLKHFPGHGSTTTNSHYATSITKRTLEQMRQCEFIPFIAGIEAGAEIVMISHLTAVNVDDSAPASLNRTIITDILRGELGYDGLVTTDALRMNAISDNYTSAEACLMAVEAGVDMLLMPSNFKSGAQAILDAVESGELDEARIDESVTRILKVKLKYGICE